MYGAPSHVSLYITIVRFGDVKEKQDIILHTLKMGANEESAQGPQNAHKSEAHRIFSAKPLQLEVCIWTV
jgi:hypothetical protein